MSASDRFERLGVQIDQAVAEVKAAASQDKAKLQAHVERWLQIDSRYLVEIVVTNTGGSTAARVKVEGTLRKGERTVETASTTFDYVPAHSQARGGMLFTHDPGAHDMTVEPKAYTEP